MTAPATLSVEGFVAPGFEPVAETLGSAPDLHTGGAAFAAYVDGSLALDIRTGFAHPGQPWQEDTLMLIASVTKGLAALCIELLADRGLIDVDELVTTYWPEYGQNGKQDTTVRMIQMHTCGVIGFPTVNQLLKWDGTGWDDLDGIAAGLAAAKPAWVPGTQHGYHAVTYGWLVGELVRRVTGGTTLGQFFKKEYAEPLGADVHIGATPDVLARVAKIELLRQDELKGPERFAMNLVSRRLKGGTLAAQAFLGDGKDSIMSSIDKLLANDKFLNAEVPASNGLATARGLARTFQVLARGGEVDGHRYLSAESVAEWIKPASRRGDYILKKSIPFSGLLGLEKKTLGTRTLGFTANEPAPGATPAYGPTPQTVAAEGAGGHIMFADPVRRVSCGFVRSQMSGKHNTSDPLFASFYSCLDNLA
jgi:CubicO group peptidase (beta-lactamase class C family)